MKEILLSVVLGTYNRKKYLRAAVQSIRDELKEFEFGYELIVIDGGSDDGTINWLSKQKDIISIIQHNRGTWNRKKLQRRSWGFFMNLGFKSSAGKYVCMVSDDCLIVPGAIIYGINYFEKLLSSGKNIGAMAFYFRDWPENMNYFVNIEFGKMYVNHGLYLKKALDKVGYIDEEYDFYNADIDLCLMLDQAGFITIDSENSFVEHLTHTESGIRKINNSKRSEDNERILNKWLGIYYNHFDDLKKMRYSREKQFTDRRATYKKFYSLNLRFSLLIHKVYKRHFKNLFYDRTI
jgi:glycosyltransferase involved in cell wall biosynthesis